MEQITLWVEQYGDVLVSAGFLVLIALVFVRVWSLKTVGERDEPHELVDMWQIAATRAYDIVTGIEQMYQAGTLTAENRLPYAMQQLRIMIPGLTEDQQRVLIESAVYMVKMGSNLRRTERD